MKRAQVQNEPNANRSPANEQSAVARNQKQMHSRIKTQITNPLFSGEYLRRLIFPLVAEQFLAMTIGACDTIMVSSVGEAGVSGVSLIDQFSQLMIQLFAAFATGGAVVSSQYLGRKDAQSARRAAKQLLYISFAAGALILAVCVPLRKRILAFLYGKIASDVMNAALVYFVWIFFSFPFLAVYSGCAALYRSMGNSKLSLQVSLLMNVINIGGNAVLIYGAKVGVAGAGISTLLSRAVAALVMLFLLCRVPKSGGKKNRARKLKKTRKLKKARGQLAKLSADDSRTAESQSSEPLSSVAETLSFDSSDEENLIYIDGLFDFEARPDMIKRILTIGIPSGIENSVFQIGKIFVQSFMSGFGTAAIAANAVCNSVASFANIPGSSIGLGSVTIVGQCVGAGEKEQAVHYGAKLMKITYAAMFVLCALLFVFAPAIVSLFNLSEEASALASGVIRSAMSANAVFWPMAFTMPNVLRAAGDAKFTMLVSNFSMWAFRVLFSRVISLAILKVNPEATHLALYGVWFGMYIDWIFRAAMFYTRFKSRKWLEKKVI